MGGVAGCDWVSDLVGVEPLAALMSAVFDAYQVSNTGHPMHLPFRTAADPSRTTTRENTGDRNAGENPMARVEIPPYVQSHIEDVNTKRGRKESA